MYSLSWKSNKPNRLNGKLIYSSIFIIIFIIIVISALNLPFFTISNINILRIDSKSEYVVSVQILEKLKNRNIFLLSNIEIETLFKENNKLISSVKVEKIIPNTVNISIIEYVPKVAVVHKDFLDIYDTNGVQILTNKYNQILIPSEFADISTFKIPEVSFNVPHTIFINDTQNTKFELKGNLFILIDNPKLKEYVFILESSNLLKALGSNEKMIKFDSTKDLQDQLRRLDIILSKLVSDNSKWVEIDVRSEKVLVKEK